MSASALAALLDRSVRRVAVRLSELEARVATGEESAWPQFLEAAKVLALLPLGGWKSEKMMRRYAAVTDQTLRRATEAVAGNEPMRASPRSVAQAP